MCITLLKEVLQKALTMHNDEDTAEGDEGELEITLLGMLKETLTIY